MGFATLAAALRGRENRRESDASLQGVARGLSRLRGRLSGEQGDQALDLARPPEGPAPDAEPEIPTFIPQEGRRTVTPQGRERLALDEGRKNTVYKDSEGIRTIGVGFNLEAPGHSRAVFEKVLPDVDMDAVIEGRQELTDPQVDALFDESLSVAEEDAREVVPSFDTLPQNVQDALVNMAFNLGRSRLAGFKKMLAAVEARDGAAAQREALDSKWARQVKGRATRIARELSTLRPERNQE